MAQLSEELKQDMREQGFLEVDDFKPGDRVVYMESTSEEIHGCVTAIENGRLRVWYGNDLTNGQLTAPYELNRTHR
jgi:FKBP-type peptidyl-prolyl cis-trans isomerase 2